jgi:hypothetical protein
MTTNQPEIRHLPTPVYCDACMPMAGPFTRNEAAEHMRDVHRNLAANGSGPPWNVKR